MFSSGEFIWHWCPPLMVADQHWRHESSSTRARPNREILTLSNFGLEVSLDRAKAAPEEFVWNLDNIL